MELESITGAAVEEKAVPPFFRELMRRGCLDAGEIRAASDGFYAAAKSLADILVGQGITTFPNDRDELRDCDKFYRRLVLLRRSPARAGTSTACSS